MGGSVKRIVGLTLVMVFVLMGISGCSGSLRETSFDIDSIQFYIDIPGITTDEIEAIENLAAKRKSFSYVNLYSTETFILQNGELAGFTVYFCNLLSGLFGIPFIPVVYDWDYMISGFDSGAFDFTGELTATPERLNYYFMTQPIAERSLSITKHIDSPITFSEERDIEGKRIGFYAGSINPPSIKNRFAGLEFEVVDAANATEVVEMLETGHIDAFITDSVLSINFDSFDSVQSREFTQMIYTPASLSTTDPELEVIISVVDKYLDAGGIDKIYKMHEMGHRDYLRFTIGQVLTDDESDFIQSLIESGAKVPITLEHDYYPICFFNETENEHQGVAVDILNEISLITGIEFETVTNRYMPWANVLRMLRTNEISLVSELVYSAERSGQFLWSDPYASSNYALISKADYPDLKMYQVPKALVGIIRGTVYEDMYKDWFQDDSNVVYFDAQYQLLEALEKGEIDLLMGTENDLLSLMNYREMTGYKINILFSIEEHVSSFGFNLNQVELHSIFNKAQELIDTERISKSWNSRIYDYSRRMAYDRFVMMGAFALVLIVGLVLMVILLIKNWRMSDAYKKQSVTMNAIYESIPDIIFCKDINGVYLNTNKNFLKNHKITSADVIGKTDREAFNLDEKTLKRYENADKFVLSENKTISVQESIEDSGKNRRVVETIKAPLIQSGQTIGLLAISRDITKLKETEEAANKASQAKSDFLARMSHEIRTPMNAILGMAELALRENMPDSAREHISTIRHSGANLLSIINDILDLSKIETGKLGLLAGDYHFSSLVGDVVGIIRTRILDSRLRFMVNIDGSIPNALFGDEVRIRQIMLNLLGNAVKYTDKGFVSFSINGKVTDSETVILTVVISDSGRGIKEKNLDKLFDEFTQFDMETNRGIEGSGLGLAITHSLVKAMGGNISVSSEYGKGSIFTVTLPQKFNRSERIARIQSPRKQKVLVYERRENCADSIMRTMKNLGVIATFAATHEEFQEKLKDTDYNFVFVAASLYASVSNTYPDLESNAKIVLIAEYGETVAETKHAVLSTPIYSIPVANILNGAPDFYLRDGLDSSRSGDTFAAPDAQVLIVDDINANLKVAEGLLLPYRMKIDLRKSGPEAIEALRTKRYDLVFMDHKMPGMDGIEATKHIRDMGDNDSYYNSVPIVALTANAVTGAKEMFLKNGFNDFLSKPIEVTRLNKVLEKWIPSDKRLEGKM